MCVKSQHTVICNMADLVQWHSQRTVKQKKRRNRNGLEEERFGRNPLCPLAPPFPFVCFSIFVCQRQNVSHSRTIVNLFDKLNVASLSSWPVFVISWSVTQINHVNRARVLIGWQLPTHELHECQSFTPHIRVYQHEKVGEEVGENRGKFYLSRLVCQRVSELFLCRSHAPTWVCQHQFANFSLLCEGRLKLCSVWGLVKPVTVEHPWGSKWVKPVTVLSVTYTWRIRDKSL